MRTSTSRASRLIPLYHQVYLHLRDLIANRPADETSPLPSEPKLAAQLGVSRVTIRTTLSQLEAEGLVRRVHGVGTFPMQRRDDRRQRARAASTNGPDEDTVIDYLESSADALPDASAAAALGPDRCVKLVHLISRGGEPLAFITTSVPTRYRDLLTVPPQDGGGLAEQLEQAGIVAQSGEQVISAVTAAYVPSLHLNVSFGSPLLAIRRTLFTQGREPILHSESLYVPERSEHRMKLGRTSVGNSIRWTPIG